MNNAMANKLSKQKLQQIITTLGPQVPQDDTTVEAADYNWNQPRYFSDSQLKKLEDFTDRLASAISENFSNLYNTDFNASVNSNTQHFASEFQNSDSQDQQNDYYLVFSTEQDPHAGFIGIPAKTAIDWATQLLGDSETNQDQRDLSQLEESLLLDILTELVKAISKAHGSYNFQHDNKIVKGKLPVKMQESEELIKIAFNVQKADSKNSAEAYILILSSKLAPLVGKSDQSDEQFSSDDISGAILQNLQQMPVPITTKLASTTLTFEQVMSLQPNDILLLGKKTDDTLEVVVEGKTLFRGKPAKCNGKYAVMITEKCKGKE